MKNNKGFTLMELIIVIAIISILSAVIIPSLMSYINKAKITKDVSTAKEIEKAIQMALSDPNVSQESINYAVKDWGNTGILLYVVARRAYLDDHVFEDKPFCRAICENLGGENNVSKCLGNDVNKIKPSFSGNHFIITLSSTGEISIHSDVRTPDNKFESIYPNKTGKYAKY